MTVPKFHNKRGVKMQGFLLIARRIFLQRDRSLCALENKWNVAKDGSSEESPAQSSIDSGNDDWRYTACG